MDFEDIKTWVRENKKVAIAVAVFVVLAVLAALGGTGVDPEVLP